MKLVKIRFIRDALYRVRGYSHPDNPVFKEGSTHEFREDIARRWLKRGVAVVEKPKEEKKAEANVNELQADSAAPASPVDGDNGGDKSPADKRVARKGVARDN